MKEKTRKNQTIVIYTDSAGKVLLRADIEKETVWASLDQIALIFGRDKSVISRHIKDIFKQQELNREATVAKNATVQIEGEREIRRIIEYFNLDVILSVGYRVNSKQATRFRKWATKTLREYIIKGIAINAERIKQLHEEGIKDLQSKIVFIQNTIRKKELNKSEVDSLLSVISDYANSWVLLRKYDDGDLAIQASKKKGGKHINYAFAHSAINKLKSKLIKDEDMLEVDTDTGKITILNT